MPRSGVLVVLALFAVLPARVPAAADADRREAAQHYAHCLDLARDEPAKALERARTWRDMGGGDPARHCAGVALMRLERYAEAGRHLEDLARTMAKGSGAGMRAQALAQAGQAWLLAGKPARAETVYAQALELRPNEVELWIDRALARFEMADYWKAIDDLNRAHELARERADVLVFRASAYRHVDALTMARSDIRQALERDPDNPEGLLERGILHRLSGDTESARSAWLRVVRVAPDSPAADSARANLARLDVAGARPMKGAGDSRREP